MVLQLLRRSLGKSDAREPDSAINALREVATRMRAARRECLPSGYNVGPAWDILCELEQSRALGERPSLAELTRRLRIDPVAMTAHLYRLSEDGFVSVDLERMDDRSQPVGISAHGLSLVKRVFGAALEDQFSTAD